MQGSEPGGSMIWRSRLVSGARGIRNDRSAGGVQQLEGSRPFGVSSLGGCVDEDERKLCAGRLSEDAVDDLGTGCCGRCILPGVPGDGHGLLVLDVRV